MTSRESKARYDSTHPSVTRILRGDTWALLGPFSGADARNAAKYWNFGTFYEAESPDGRQWLLYIELDAVRAAGFSRRMGTPTFIVSGKLMETRSGIDVIGSVSIVRSKSSGGLPIVVFYPPSFHPKTVTVYLVPDSSTSKQKGVTT